MHNLPLNCGFRFQDSVMVAMIWWCRVLIEAILLLSLLKMLIAVVLFITSVLLDNENPKDPKILKP